MNLYLVSQKANMNDYTFDSFVACCETEEEAKNMNPCDGQELDWNGCWETSSWCQSVEDVSVVLIGVAEASIARGVVCSSYNAG